MKRKFRRISSQVDKMNGVSKKGELKYDNRHIVKNDMLRRLDIIRATTKKLAKKTFTR